MFFILVWVRLGRLAKIAKTPRRHWTLLTPTGQELDAFLTHSGPWTLLTPPGHEMDAFLTHSGHWTSER